MEPLNGILGDAQSVDLPKAQLDEAGLNEERRMAKYSKTDEFKRIKKHFEERIKFYQSFLPDGRSVVDVPVSELGNKWLLANAIIIEFEAIINIYEQATTAVEEANKANA